MNENRLEAISFTLKRIEEILKSASGTGLEEGNPAHDAIEMRFTTLAARCETLESRVRSHEQAIKGLTEGLVDRMCCIERDQGESLKSVTEWIAQVKGRIDAIEIQQNAIEKDQENMARNVAEWVANSAKRHDAHVRANADDFDEICKKHDRLDARIAELGDSAAKYLNDVIKNTNEHLDSQDRRLQLHDERITGLNKKHDEHVHQPSGPASTTPRYPITTGIDVRICPDGSAYHLGPDPQFASLLADIKSLRLTLYNERNTLISESHYDSAGAYKECMNALDVIIKDHEKKQPEGEKLSDSCAPLYLKDDRIHPRARLPVGSVVGVTQDDGRVVRTKTCSEPWMAPNGQWLVMLEGHTGGYSLDRVTPIFEMPPEV